MQLTVGLLVLHIYPVSSKTACVGQLSLGEGRERKKEERKRSSWQGAEIGVGLGPLAHSLVSSWER